MRDTRIARACALLIALACTDAAAPTPDIPLPDALTSGTFNVRNLVVPADKQHTVEGDVVVIAEGRIQIDGDIVVLPGATLGLAAGDSLIINGSITEESPPEAGPIAGVTLRETAHATSGGGVYIAGRFVVLNSDASVEGDARISLRRNGGMLDIGGVIEARDGAHSTQRGVPGEKGGDIEIGTQAADAYWQARGVSDTRVPPRIRIRRNMLAGSGGDGFDDVVGVLEGRTLRLWGSNGGDGGSVRIRAEIIDEDGGHVLARSGGDAGSCGSEQLPARGEDGTAVSERGVSIDCITGDAGARGQVIFNGELVREGSGGIVGKVFVRAGNGGPAGNGGSVTVQVGNGFFPLDYAVRIYAGGNGGAGHGVGWHGGPGGDISVLTLAGGPVGSTHSRAANPIRFEGSVANGGAGFNGCLRSPFSAGSPGGDAGNLIVRGARYTLPEGVSFNGGHGGDGRGPAEGGNRGTDDAGNVLGLFGRPGISCNLIPAVTEISPAEVRLADGPIQINLTGTDFAPGACTAKLDGDPIPTTCTSATAATTEIPVVKQIVGAPQLCMANGQPGGGSGTECKSVNILNRVLVLSSTDHAELQAGSPATQVTARGQHFVAGTELLLDNAALATTVVSPTEATAQLSQGVLAIAGTHTLKLQVRDDPGSASEPRSLIVYNPTPGALTLSPSSTEVDAPPFTLRASATGLNSGTVLKWNGVALPTTLENPNTVSAPISGDKLNVVAQLVDVSLFNGLPRGGEVTERFALNNPRVEIIGVTPPRLRTGALSVPVQITGVKVKPGAKVFVDGVLSTFPWTVGNGTISGTLDAPSTPRTLRVQVKNDEPTLGLSNELTIEALDLPTVSGISPTTAFFGRGDQTVVITGSKFESDTRVQIGTEPLTTIFNSPTQLTAAVPGSKYDAVGTLEFSVVTPFVGTSVGTVLQPVVYAVPSITSLSKTAAVAGDETFTVTVNGTDFAPISVAKWDGTITLPRQHITATSTAVTIDASLLIAGTHTITIETGSQATSNGATFTVMHPQVEITGVTPPRLRTGALGVPVQITGLKIKPGAKVLVDGVPTSFPWTVGNGTISGTLDAPSTPRTVRLRAINAEPTVGPSNELTIEALDLPTVSGISPTKAFFGRGDQTVVMTGSKFESDSRVQIGTEPLTTIFNSPTQLTAAVPGAKYDAVGTIDFSAVTPFVGTSAGISQSVVYAAPTITSLSKTAAVAGDETFTITINGTDFAPISVAKWDGTTTLPREHITATSTVVTIDASLLTAGDHTITMETGPPEGGASNRATFTVTEPVDPCTQSITLAYGSSVSGTLTTADCNRGTSSFPDYTDRFSVTTTQQASALTLTASPQASVRVFAADAFTDGVFSLGSTISRKAFLAPGTYTVEVSAGTGSTDPASYTLMVGPASSEDIANCQPAVARVHGDTPISLMTQVLTSMDCTGNNRFDTGAGIAYRDEIKLSMLASETVTIDMVSSAYQPVVRVIRDGTSEVMTGMNSCDPMNPSMCRSTITFTAAISGQHRVELTNMGANRGATEGPYGAVILRNP